jgi:spermidine synthase
MDGLNLTRRARALPILLFLFFLSGATSLVYQTLWARRLHLVFGTTQFAVATVLAAFMGGLALGGFWMARRADSVERPCRLYGFLELGIGAYALAFPWLLEATTPLSLQFYRSTSPGPVAFGVWQLVVVGALLVVPTACMGATLPLLARFVSTHMGRVGQKIGVLYGVNTLGAVFGVWLGGFILLPHLGLAHTNLVAAAANGLLGAAALILSRATDEGGSPPTVEGASEHVAPQRALLGIAALSGAAALIYELAWFRLMCLILGGSTYAFSTMLLAFLVGIALGGWAGGHPADLALRRWGRAGPMACLVGVQLAIGISTAALLWVYPELPYLFVKLYDPGAPAHGLSWARQIWLAVGVMTLPAVFMGATFPLLVRASVSRDALGRAVGRIYGANTLGSLAGAVLAGFVLLPTLHILGSVQVGVALNGLAACIAAVVLWKWGAISRRVAAIGLAAAVGMGVLLANPPPWNPLWMTAGTYKYVSEISDLSRKGVESFAVEDYELLYYDEGFSTVVTVARSLESGNIWLANNGKVEASTTVDMLTQVLVGHLPFLFREDAGKALLIGLASGITAGSLALHEGLESIEVVELEPSIVEASHAFDDFNHRPLEDPRVQLVLADGRNHLLFSEPGTYDLIKIG